MPDTRERASPRGHGCASVRRMKAHRLVTLLALAVAATAALLAHAARAATSEDVTIASSDGTPLAATITIPDGTPPVDGWPAIVFLHGLAGNRSQGLAIADAMGVGSAYAVLAFDARGHGASGGKVELDGPKEVADARAVFDWLKARPDVSDTRIGAWGISYGGGAILNSLAAGVPWAAAETAITFSDLTRALYPQNLAKSGIIAGFVASLDPARVDGSVTEARDAAFRGDTAAVRAFATPRSSLGRLRSVTTPVYVMQGRRDFAFDLDQGLPAFAALGGSKKLWIGNIGHAVSSFPGPDTTAMLADGRRWFDRFLLGARNGVDQGPRITIASEGSATTSTFASVPSATTVAFRSSEARTMPTRAARGAWKLGPTTRRLEVFGAPTVTATVRAAGGWSRLVAVVSAATRAGVKLVAVGGAPLANGSRKATVRLISTATAIPAGARLTLTLAASSAAAPGTAALTYLDLPMPEAATLQVRDVTLSLPVLRTPLPS